MPDFDIIQLTARKIDNRESNNRRRQSPNIKAVHQFCDPYHLRFFKDFKSIVDVATRYGFTLFAVIPDRSKPGQSSSLYGTGINANNKLWRQE